VPYHVRVSTHSNRTEDEVRLDLTEAELEERFLRPYREGRPIVIGGRTVDPGDLARLRVNFTDETSAQLLPIVQQERRESRVMTAIPNDWYIADRGHELTDELITGPPGSALPPAPTATATDAVPAAGPDPRSVVVHGRNRQARDAMITFLRALSLQPIEWNEAVRATGRPTPYVGEVLDAAFARAQIVVVLMTPDDEARLRDAFHEPGDPPHETASTPQARPNVLFEAGMAMGRDENRVVLVEFGSLRPFSDIGGRHAVRSSKQSQRFRTCGSKKSNKLAGHIYLRAATSAFSWGERVTVSVLESGQGRSQVQISSAAKTIAGSATTHGRNRKNVQQIISVMTKILEQNGEKWTEEFGVAATQHPSRSPADEIRKLAELHQSGVLTDEEFTPRRKSFWALDHRRVQIGFTWP
jgi:predicted nucleotide-binding protein